MWCTKWLVMVFTNRFQNGPKFGPNLSQFGPFLQISGQRHGPSTNSGFGQSLFADISPLQTFLHVNLGLPEFSQINGSNFLCFFNLPKIKNKIKNIFKTMWMKIIQSFKCFVLKVVFFRKWDSFFKSPNLKKKLFQITILSLKFE